MLPAAYIPFFAASMGAAGALIGLLFIAISIAPERTVGDTAAPVRAALAGNGFTALTDVFFISFVGLIPKPTIGPVLILVGTLSCVSTLRLAINLLRGRNGKRLSPMQFVRRTSLVATSLLIYGLQVWQGAQMVRASHLTSDAFAIVTILIILVYGLALVRMWALLGARRDSMFAWLSVLNDLDDD